MEKPSSPERVRPLPLRRGGRWRQRRLRTIALVPTLITMGNGVCGFVAILQIAIGIALKETADLPRAMHIERAGWLILAAMVFDALDGFVARKTGTASKFGAQLDSLCDLVTFGIAPGFLVFAVHGPGRIMFVVSTLYAMCALIRLARFTVETAPDESAHREFTGLPSPAAAGVIAAAVLPLRALKEFSDFTWMVNWVLGALPGLAFALGILMVSRVKYAHVINRVLRGRRPFVTLVELALVVGLLFLCHEFAFFLVFFFYAVTGPLLWLKNRIFRKPAPAAAPGAPPPQESDESLF